MLTGRAMRRHAGHVLAVDQDAAGVGRLEAGQQAQQRGLAAARAAQQGEQLAAFDVEIDAVDGGDRAEALGDALRCGRSGVAAHTHRPVLIVVHSRVRSRVCSALPAVMV